MDGVALHARRTRSTPAQPRTAPTSASPSGIVVAAEDGKTIYFAGDTCVFGDMQLIGRIYEPDVAVLPIGDHYTMGPTEAAVALELLGVKRSCRATGARSPLLTGTPDQLERSPARRHGREDRTWRLDRRYEGALVRSDRPAGARARGRGRRSTWATRSFSTRRRPDPLRARVRRRDARRRPRIAPRRPSRPHSRGRRCPACSFRRIIATCSSSTSPS